MTLSSSSHEAAVLARHRLVKLVKRQVLAPLAQGDGSDQTAGSSPAGATDSAAGARTTAAALAQTTAAAPAAQTTQAAVTQAAQTTQATQQAQTTQQRQQQTTQQQQQQTTQQHQAAQQSTTANARTTSSQTPSTTDRSRSSASSSSASSGSSLSSILVSSAGTSVVVLSVPTNAFSAGSISSASASAAAATSGATSDGSGPSAGTVVGIVAGSLVGLVVLAGLVGMFLKTRWGKKDQDYQDNPFGDEKDFGRLPDGSDDGLSLLSRSNTAAHQHLANLPAGLSRSGTNASSSAHSHQGGLAGWRVDPDAPPLPSFQPGQVLAYGNGGRTPSPQPPPMGQYGPGGAYPPNGPGGPFLAPNGYMMPPPPVGSSADGHVALLERAASARYANGGGASPAPSTMTDHYGNVVFNGSSLLRQASMASAYSRGGPTPAPMALAAAPQPDLAHPHQHGRPLSLVHEESETAGSARNSDAVVNRTGTPTHPNVQQSYYHRQEDSFGSGGSAGRGMPSRDNSQTDFVHLQSRLRADGHLPHQAGGPEGVTRQLTNPGQYRGQVPREDRVKRTLSVRNGGLNEDEEDPYGGI